MQVAEQISVHPNTITNWELNATEPPVKYIPQIVRFLGYNPFPIGRTIPEQLAAARKALGLSQKEMAERLGVDETTLRGWEAGWHMPIKRHLDKIERTIARARSC